MDNKNKRKIYLDLCYGDLSWNAVEKQYGKEFTKKFLLNGTSCRYCKKAVNREDAEITTTYWWPRYSLSHKACKTQGEQSEAYECQTIDANCNDCRYFNRKHNAGNGVYYGACKKPVERGSKKPYWFNELPFKWRKRSLWREGYQVRAESNYATGYECFVHRKTRVS